MLERQFQMGLEGAGIPGVGVFTPLPCMVDMQAEVFFQMPVVVRVGTFQKLDEVTIITLGHLLIQIAFQVIPGHHLTKAVEGETLVGNGDHRIPASNQDPE